MVAGSASSTLDDSILPDPFEIVSIRSVVTPSGLSGSEWHRYEICQGINSIVGYRSGSADNVREAVESIVAGLNHRRRNQRGRVHVVLQSARKAAASEASRQDPGQTAEESSDD